MSDDLVKRLREGDEFTFDPTQSKVNIGPINDPIYIGEDKTMSDDLVKQGRAVGRDLNNGFPVTSERCLIIEQMADRIEEMEAKLAKAVSFTGDVAYRATTIEHDQDEMWLLDLDALRHQRDCDITQARTTLAELRGQDDE